MKNISLKWGSWVNTLLIVALIALVSHKTKTTEYGPKGILPDANILHIGLVVENIETSLDKWVEMLGVEKRPTVNIAEGHHENPTTYLGKPTKGKAKIVFIRADNIQIELLEPIGDEKSYWRDFLEKYGPSVHHIGVNVKELGEKYVDIFDKAGYPLVQHGGWNGGEYGYMGTQKDLGVVIELLEHYR